MASTATTTATKKGTYSGWEIRCEDQSKPVACGFILRNHDWDELARFAKEHLRNTHKMELSDADLKKSAVAVTW